MNGSNCERHGIEESVISMQGWSEMQMDEYLERFKTMMRQMDRRMDGGI